MGPVTGQAVGLDMREMKATPVLIGIGVAAALAGTGTLGLLNLVAGIVLLMIAGLVFLLALLSLKRHNLLTLRRSAEMAPATGELLVIVDEHRLHSRAELDLTSELGAPNPYVVGVQLTLYPSLPMQIARFQIEVDSKQIQAMGRIVKDATGSRFQPLELETVDVPTGFNIGFEVPHTVAQGRQRVRIVVSAAGKPWPSEFFDVGFPTYA